MASTRFVRLVRRRLPPTISFVVAPAPVPRAGHEGIGLVADGHRAARSAGHLRREGSRCSAACVLGNRSAHRAAAPLALDAMVRTPDAIVPAVTFVLATVPVL